MMAYCLMLTSLNNNVDDNSGIMFSYEGHVEYGRLKEIFWHTYDSLCSPRAYGRIEWYTRVHYTVGYSRL